MESGNSSTGTVFLALLGGAVLGAGVALLYAPQSGRRTRQRLRELGEDAGERLRDLVDSTEECLEEAKCRGDAWMHKGHGCAEEKRQQAAAAAAQGAH